MQATRGPEDERAEGVSARYPASGRNTAGQHVQRRGARCNHNRSGHCFQPGIFFLLLVIWFFCWEFSFSIGNFVFFCWELLFLLGILFFCWECFCWEFWFSVGNFGFLLGITFSVCNLFCRSEKFSAEILGKEFYWELNVHIYLGIKIGISLVYKLQLHRFNFFPHKLTFCWAIWIIMQYLSKM